MKAILYSDPFARKTPFGTGRYARHLLTALREIDPKSNFRPVSTWTDCDEAGQKALVDQYGWEKLPWIRKCTASAWAFFKAPSIEYWTGKEHDLVHVLECVYPVRTKKPLIVTIHDLGPLTHPDLFTSVRPWLMRRGLQQAIDEAATIIAVSQSTADIFEDHFKIDLGDRLQIVHEGVNPQYLETPDSSCLDTVKDLPSVDTPFLMTMGAISPRKNLPNVIAALERLADKIPHHLVHVGIPHWDTDEFFVKLKQSPFANRIHLPGYLSDAQVHALYNKAEAYIFPSLFEGFGLPILEAMACGCPVITSNVSSMPEIAGDAALLIDPNDLEEMTDAILKVATDRELNKQLRQNGNQRIKKFSWKQCAEETHKIYTRTVN